MKLRHLALCSLAILVLLRAGAALAAGPAAAPERPAAAPERSSYWHERTSLFKTLAHRADVAMIGDSLTDGAEWAELFPGVAIVNRGIDGDTTDGVLARLDGILAHKPRLAFLMIGINDFADERRDVDAVFADYRAIVARLDRAGVRVYVQSTLPCNEEKGAWRTCWSLNGKIGQLNARLATLATRRVTFVDLRPLMADDDELKGELTYDGVHLNGAGYRLWKRAIARFVAGARTVPGQRQR